MLPTLPFLAIWLGSATAQYDYGEVLEKSIMFYEAQRSGPLPDDNRIGWRGDSALDDGSDHGLDLAGGWFDAGDHVKFGLPGAATVTLLAWGVYEFEDAYSSTGQLEFMLDCIKWQLDYYIKCHSQQNVFYAQVGDGFLDHAFWGRPEEMAMERPSHFLNASMPGSEVVGETAAAMAASSLLFRNSDSAYADELLEHARGLYDFAYNHQGKYTDWIPADAFYGSSRYEDELAWAALWLYIATGEDEYLEKCLEFYDNSIPKEVSWDEKMAATQVLYTTVVPDDEARRTVAENFLRSWYPGGSGNLTYTPGGLAWMTQWGPLRYSANVAFTHLVAYKHGIMVDETYDWAKGQLDYALGDNPLGRSYVVGFGNDPPHSVHHRAASCEDLPAPCDFDDLYKPEPNPQILYGGLSGGPDAEDQFEDDREDYVKNEVACDYNSGFQSSIAGLISLSLQEKK